MQRVQAAISRALASGRSVLETFRERHWALALSAEAQADLRADLRAIGELLATVSVYGAALVMGALWVGLAVRAVRAVAGF